MWHHLLLIVTKFFMGVFALVVRGSSEIMFRGGADFLEKSVPLVA
jgi:hypothetical protein